MSSRARLKIDSVFYDGWKAFSISESIETVASSFRLSVTDNWNNLSWPIKDGDLCEVFLGDEKLLTGYIDSVEASVSSSERTIEVSGRSKASDLVDCSADGKSAYTGLKLEALTEKLISPFGLTVTLDEGVTTGAVIQNVGVSIGDTPFEILDKRVRQKGLLLLSGTDGNILISKPGNEYADSGLTLGENILSCSASFDSKDRFSVYKIKAQNNFEMEGLSGFQVLGRASDSNVKRFRPLVMSAANAMGALEAKTQAEFEAITRAARARKISVSAQGFFQRSGKLWKKNQVVKLNAPAIGVENDELLISDITYTLDENGSVTTFGLMRKDAFIPKPIVETKDETLLGGDE